MVHCTGSSARIGACLPISSAKLSEYIGTGAVYLSNEPVSLDSWSAQGPQGQHLKSTYLVCPLQPLLGTHTCYGVAKLVSMTSDWMNPAGSRMLQFDQFTLSTSVEHVGDACLWRAFQCPEDRTSSTYTITGALNSDSGNGFRRRHSSTTSNSLLRIWSSQLYKSCSQAASIPVQDIGILQQEQ